MKLFHRRVSGFIPVFSLHTFIRLSVLKFASSLAGALPAGCNAQLVHTDSSPVETHIPFLTFTQGFAPLPKIKIHGG